VHVSACGSHLAALLAGSRLIIIPFFERIITRAAEILEISLDIQLGDPASVSRYLAFENGRVAVVTVLRFYIRWPFQSDVRCFRVQGYLSYTSILNPPVIQSIRLQFQFIGLHGLMSL
jgi:hypothetical protein